MVSFRGILLWQHRRRPLDTHVARQHPTVSFKSTTTQTEDTTGRAQARGTAGLWTTPTTPARGHRESRFRVLSATTREPNTKYSSVAARPPTHVDSGEKVSTSRRVQSGVTAAVAPNAVNKYVVTKLKETFSLTLGHPTNYRYGEERRGKQRRFFCRLRPYNTQPAKCFFFFLLALGPTGRKEEGTPLHPVEPRSKPRKKKTTSKLSRTLHNARVQIFSKAK